ncbi:MAG TPA: GNAT family N-acetyltransferase [Gaiellaceae bacterium]
MKSAGVSVIGVLPTHRRRGVFMAMMRAQLDEALELVPPVHEAAVRARPGMFRRTRAWWETRRLENGRAVRTDDEPDLSLDVGDLGSVYLGGFTWRDLRAALRVEEHAAGAVERAGRVFGSWPKPWCPEIF